MKKREPNIELFLTHLREAHPCMDMIFVQGACFQLYLMIKAIHPDAECYYDSTEGHVYTKIRRTFYDIYGKAKVDTKNVKPMDPQVMKRAHKWSIKTFWREKT